MPVTAPPRGANPFDDSGVRAPSVGEVAVVGVPDPMMGEKVGAVIVPLPGADDLRP